LSFSKENVPIKKFWGLKGNGRFFFSCRESMGRKRSETGGSVWVSSSYTDTTKWQQWHVKYSIQFFLQMGLLGRSGAFDRQRQKLLSDRPQSKMMHTGKKISFNLQFLGIKLKYLWLLK